MKKIKRFFLKVFLVFFILGILCTMGVMAVSNMVINNAEEHLQYVVQGDVEINPVSKATLKDFDADCILVLGCGIKDEETPSDMLRDRLDVGIALYNQGLASKILLSGDNGTVEHNEIHVMLNYVKAAGIPEKDIFCDHAGFSTYDSMHRAGSIFGAEKVIVVTQEYHEYRALYIGKRLGLDVIGVASDQNNYFGQAYREGREVLARFKDFFKALVHSGPTVGGEEIPINGSGLITHGE